MVTKTYDLTRPAWESCVRFNICSCNSCPLSDKIYKNDSSDPMTKCKATKPTRKKIGKAFGLKRGGMTKSEYEGAKRWANLPQEVKDRQMARMSNLSPVSRCIKAGLKVSSKKKSNVLVTRRKSTIGAKTSIGREVCGSMEATK